jgi:hypothetical protein
VREGDLQIPHALRNELFVLLSRGGRVLRGRLHAKCECSREAEQFSQQRRVVLAGEVVGNQRFQLMLLDFATDEKTIELLRKKTCCI